MSEKIIINPTDKIFVAGHRGLVGASIVRALKRSGLGSLVTRGRQELNLTDQAAVREFFRREKPDYVIDAAAKVGGIYANNAFPADFIRDNLLIQTNIIDAAYQAGVKKLVFLGSSCIYPKLAAQPMREDCLLTGALEPTNQWYAVAKIAGIKMCQAYRLQYGFKSICLMPTNLFGPDDNFDLKNAHVLPALMRRFHEAKLARAAKVEVWGTGSPRREFLHVDDVAEAVVYCLQNYDDLEILNVGAGRDHTIKELASLVAQTVGYEGEIAFDASKPDGSPQKLMDSSHITALGWKPRIPLAEGLAATYAWFSQNSDRVRGKNPL